VVHWLTPCQPSLVGYWLLVECIEGPAIATNLFNMVWSNLWKLLIFMLNHIYWAPMVYLTVFTLIIPIILCCLTICNFLATFLDRFSQPRSPSVYENAKVYRFIQILAVLFNSIFRQLLLILITGSIFVASVCLAACVKLNWNFSNVFSLIMSLSLGVDTTAVLIVVLGGMVTSYLQSKLTFQNLRLISLSKFSKRESKHFQLFLKSCPHIKIRFGSTNFLEPLTPLNCVAFVINLTVQMLLLIN